MKILSLGGGGANTALSNLAAVAINTSLISDTDNTDDLGSATKQWRKLYAVDATLTGILIVNNGTAASPGARVTTDASGFYRVGSNRLGFSAGGAHRLELSSVGVGTTDALPFFWQSAAGAAMNTGVYRTADAIVGFCGASTAQAGGIQPAQSANGAYIRMVGNSEALTLSTVGATTDTAGNLLPANAELLQTVYMVTTTITTAASWSAGDATTAARFVSASTSLTAGNTVYGVRHRDPATATTSATGPIQTAASIVRITCNATPGAGAIRITVFSVVANAPTS